jgi:eukaryotic-like serine/threonine-protein kinase
MLKEMSNLRFGDFTLDRSLRELRRGEAVVPIPGRAFDLLSFMAANAGRPLSKSELLDAVWPETAVEESNLTQHVFMLRKVLGADGDGPIKTLTGRGYQFAAQVFEIEPATEFKPSRLEAGRVSSLAVEATATRVFVQQSVEEESSWRPARGWTIALVLVLAATGVLGWKWRQRWLDRSGGSPVKVVLTPMEGTTGDAMLDKSLTQALRMDLVQSPYVSVIPGSLVSATLTQMRRKPDEAMTPAIAREVCERTNSQGVLSGSIAKVGQHFLIAEEASNCVDGSVVAAAKYEAKNPEDLPSGMDKVAAAMRQKLGESRRSIARFDTPLAPIGTASLEALKAYTQAEAQSNQGKFIDAIDLGKKAVAADPSFTDAYYDLATFYKSTQDLPAEREAILKAYSLRDSTSEPVRLAIIAVYHLDVTQDLYEAERNYRNWTELYPRSAPALNGLSVVERLLGHHPDALIAARRAMELRPTAAGVYPNLAYEQRQTGDFKGAIATSELAIARGLDGDNIREDYFIAAYALHDAGLVQQQRDWAAAHPDAVYIPIDEIEIAITEGRFQEAHRRIPQVDAFLRRHGQADFADDLIRAEAMNLIETGDVAEGSRLFRSVPVDPKNTISVAGLARVGDFAAAESALHAMQHEFPQGTLWNDYRAPTVHALSALATHRPKDAIAALERARPLDGSNPVIVMIRADAYLAAGEPALAEKTYRQVVEGPQQDPNQMEVPLSWLGLGRALSAEGNRPAAIAAYQHFLTLWAHADSDAMYLTQAKQEFARLQN